MKFSISYSTEGLSTHFWIKNIVEQSPKIKIPRNVLQRSAIYNSGIFYNVLQWFIGKFFNIGESFRIFFFLLNCSIYISKQ